MVEKIKSISNWNVFHVLYLLILQGWVWALKGG